MHWELLLQQPSFDLRRSGRFLVADLNEPHQVLSTSVRHGGQVGHLRHLLDHQSCEGTTHLLRHRVMAEDGLDAYHDRVCAEAALPAGHTAVMGTAANMNYVAVVTKVDEELAVTAAVTDLWIGDPSDPPLETAGDTTRAVVLVVVSGLVAAAVGSVVLLRWNWRIPP